MRTFSKVGAAVALALAGGAVQALPLSQYDSTVVNVYVGGATATDNTLENTALAITGGYCVAGTIDIYRTATNNNERVVFCTVNSTRVTGFPAGGSKVAFFKESRGGSSNGVTPLIAVASGQAHSLQWLDLDQLRNAAPGNGCTSASVAATATLNGYTNWTNCNNLLTPADTAGSAGAAGRYDITAGISDVEPRLAFPAPSAANIAKLDVKPGLGVVFGVPVTKNLYRALQVAQGKTADDSPANIPTLTRSQIRGLYTGNVIDWASITSPTGTALPSVAGVTPPAQTDVFVCRRVGESGTQASFETYWLHQRCEGGTPLFLTPDDGSTINDTVWVPANPANGFVNAGPSSGNVRSCLQIMNNANVWAVGVLSTEVSATNLSDAGDGFRFAAVDGAAPTLQNTANGAYDFFTEDTLQIVKAGNTGALPAGDLRLTLVNYIRNNIGLPALLAQVNSSFQNRPWGDGGNLSVPNGTTIVPAASPATVTGLRTSPVNTQSRSTLGTTNNCAPPIQQYGQPTPRITEVLP
jgi:hypothetical protein